MCQREEKLLDLIAAGRRRRAPADPRLLIGIGLVIASVAGVVGLLAAVDTRVTVFAAASTLAPGERVERADLVERSVALEAAERLYLDPHDLGEGGLVAMVPVRAGELVPRSAVADAAGDASTMLVVEPASLMSSSVRPGSLVEVWASPADSDTGGFGPPAMLVRNAVVAGLIDGDGLTGSAPAGVELSVQREQITRILQSQADGDHLSVVPAGLPLGD